MDKILFNLVLSIFFLFHSCQSQDKNVTENERIEIFEQVWNITNEHFYDPDFNGINWEGKHNEYETKIADCTNNDSFFSLLNEMLFELNSSHCGVGLLSEIENAVSPFIFGEGDIGIDIRIIKNQIVVTNVAENSAAHNAGIKAGYLIEKIDGSALSDIEARTKFKPPFNDRNIKFHLTSEVLRHIYGKPNTRVKIDFIANKGKSNSITLTRTERKNGISLGGGLPPAHLKSDGFFVSDNIGYLRFNAFNPPNLEHVLNNYEKLKSAKGLIIDLRGNDGGSIEAMKLLLSRFVSGRLHYGTYINRYERTEDFIDPADSKYEGKAALLVDEMSISGAENMAGIFQQFNVGKVIGARTPGQMLWGNGYLINDSIALAIPIYKLEYPDGFNPENNGITPDIGIALKREDLLEGKDTQLEKAIEILKSEIENE